MSALDDFRTMLSSDPAFTERVKSSQTAEEIILVAKLAGIELDSVDLAKGLRMGSNELTDDELESVSTGTPLAATLLK